MLYTHTDARKKLYTFILSFNTFILRTINTTNILNNDFNRKLS